MPDNNTYDAIMIGGGPAGASSAAILAGYGHRVLVLEKHKFPRYHIGESLLPFTNQPLKDLGIIDKMQKSCFVKKYSVQFVSPSGHASTPFYFNDRYPDDIAQTWQVVRSEFDQMLADHARSKGAVIHEEVTVKHLLKDEADAIIGVLAVDKDGKETEYHAPITLDCSGKDAFACLRQGWRKKDPKLNKIAVWTYFKGAKRDEGIDEGATTVAFVPEKGWFWYIPQHNDMVSVGVVAEGKYLSRGGIKDPKAMFDREVSQNKWIEKYLSQGTSTGKYHITSEFSYHSEFCASKGLLLVGDAFCFLDPVFSSGLMLALKSGVMAGEAVHKAIESNDFCPSRFAEYGSTLREGIENMRKLVYAFYDPNFSFRDLTMKYPELAGDVTDCLSGDINKDFTKLFTAIGEFANMPDSLPLGGPKLDYSSVSAT
ncbi:tryptophan 7-halogenase [Verrucomicrobia bacterium]|nr:tryptophan 7-halogenase [Verrucomicrobiota bacterium]